jgi:hypothetical protein
MKAPRPVEFEIFLSSADVRRVERVIGKLMRHDIASWVLAGSFALEAHKIRLGIDARQRTLHDIDFVVDSFEHIAETLGQDFALRHIHPYDPPAKTLLQAIELEDAVRFDVFRTHRAVIERSETLMLSQSSMLLISLEDLVARLLRLGWNLVDGNPVGSKYARDLVAALELGDPGRLEIAWQDHRKPEMPAMFRDATGPVLEAMASHPELLITPEYSKDPTLVCHRCHEAGELRLADAAVILSRLGYC